MSVGTYTPGEDGYSPSDPMAGNCRLAAYRDHAQATPQASAAVRDMARTALGDDPAADYNPTNPGLSNYMQRAQAARAAYAENYPPHTVDTSNGLPAVSVTIRSDSYGGEITTNDNRNEEND